RCRWNGFLELDARGLALRARRIAVVNLVAPPLQVGIALEYVLVERGLFQDAARIQQVRALADRTRHPHRVALAHRPMPGHGVEIDVRHQADAVARRARAQERPDEVRAIPDPPAAEGLAEILVVLLVAHVRGDVADAEKAEGRVEGEAHPVAR